MSSDIRDKNMIVQSFKNKGLRGEVIALISDDADYGLTREQIAKYADKKMDIDRMRIYSECLRNGYEDSIIKIITADGLSKAQMQMALEFYKKGVSEEEIEAITKSGEKAAVMKKRYEEILDMTDSVYNVAETEPEYVKKIAEHIQEVVLSIGNTDKKFDDIAEVLKSLMQSRRDEYVFDISENSKDGKIDIYNDMVKTDITLEKQDSKTNEPIGNAKFGFYSKDNIYNKNGNVIVAAGEKIATVTTDKEGKAKIPFDVPVMDEGYGKMEGNLNSGDYYFLEESVSKSYYINREKHHVHLEYKDQETAVVSAKAVVKEDQTETVISKRMIASSVEIKDCHLKISDENGNEIVSWITGDISSVKLNEKIDEMGYDNVHVEKGDGYAVKIYGLLHDREYTLTETKPADGFVTANDIIFKLVESDDANAKTKVLIKNGDSFNENIDNQVIMYDDTTKIEFSKTDITNGKELPGCHMQVTDKDTGKVMDEWVSSEQSHVIEGKYAVGKTYVLTETKARDGYATATNIEFTVADDGKVQKVNMADDTIKVEFNKIASDTKKQLGGAKYKVYDSKGKKVYEFTTGKKAEFIEGMFKAGETYIFKEVDAPEHYKVAKDKKIRIKDTGKVQKLTVTDERIPVVPDTPQTGINGRTAGMAVSLISLLLALGCFACVRAKDKSKYNFKQEKDDEEDN